jgi:hypothetical protein
MEEPTTAVQSAFDQFEAENIERDKKTKEVRRASLIATLLDALDDVCPLKELCALIADFVPLDWHLKQRAPSLLDDDSRAIRMAYKQEQIQDEKTVGRLENAVRAMERPEFHFLAVVASSECNRYHAISFSTHRDKPFIAWKHEIRNVIGLVDFECKDQPIVLLATPFMRSRWANVRWDQSSLHFVVIGTHRIRGWVCPRSRTLVKITEFPGACNRITHSGVDLATTREDGVETVYLCEFLGATRRILPPLLTLFPLAGCHFSEMCRTEDGIVFVPVDPPRARVYCQLAMLCGSGVDLPPEGQPYAPLVFPL